MKTWDAVYQEWQTDDGQIHAMRMGLLIRCKDCKYYSYGTIEGKHLCMSVKYRFTPTAEDEWCSRAERKEE